MARVASNPDYITAVVASPRAILREGLISLLNDERDISVEDQCSNILQLGESVEKIRPRIVIFDEEIFSTPAVHDIITQIASVSRILLFLKDYSEETELSGLKLGIKGFLLESSEKADLIKCIRAMSKGEMWVRRQIIENLIQDSLTLLPELDVYPGPITSLSKREQDIIFLVCKGFRNKEIGNKLYISEKTVKHHLTRIFKKLNVNKRGELRNIFRFSLPH